jgi:hypothetical protein
MRILVLLAMLSLSGCYISRSLDTPAKIRVKANGEPVISDCYNAKYIGKNNAFDYKQKFLDGLKTSLGVNNLIVVESEAEIVDYTLVVFSMEVKESLSSETVSDEKSPYNGQSFEVSNCTVSAILELYKGDMGDPIDDFSVSADKEEKLTNHRNLGDYIFGQNKDNSTYRYKELPDDIFLNLSNKCGERTCARVTAKITKLNKK